MKARQFLLLCAVIVGLSVGGYMPHARAATRDRSGVMGQTLLAAGYGEQAVSQVQRACASSADDPYAQQKVCFSIEPRVGYMRGETAYDWQHQRSELIFPYDNWMAGAAVSVSKGPCSLNGEFWMPVEGDAGDMTDRDWIDGILFSETFSRSELDALILDGNLRYEFFRRTLDTTYDDVALWRDDTVTVSGLIGYRYERYDYDIYDLYYNVDLFYGQQGQHLYSGTKVLTYKIEYFLPYLGFACDVKRGDFGLGGSFKYSFYPTAEHVDNHLLRGLTLYADYDEGGVSLLGTIYGYWDFLPQWRLRGGCDLMLSRLDGTNRDESGDPGWVGPISTDMRYVLGWLGVEYTF